ncbi:hypothetical protein Maes01_01401 [Microbulbifer aestuariivivens]|uniref:Outer membrane protein beta-barrel domain-containing protein n=1 Tax=Microbulbifer aestuariivivens TaxID=1908308 RepID=A0ABP9WNP6_9GAMM
MTRSSVLLAVPLLALPALASADFYSHRYGGISVGSVEQQNFCRSADSRINRFDTDAQDVSGRSCENGSEVFKIYSGWRWTPNLAVEASVQQLQDNRLGFTLSNDQDEFLQIEEKVKTRLVTAHAVGHLPFFNGASFFAKAGGGYWMSELSSRLQGELLFPVVVEDEVQEQLAAVNGRDRRADNGFHWSYGAGISYRNENRWTIRAEWESFRNVGSDDLRGAYDLHTLSLGVSLHF